ncbi:hypothetical protein ACFV98_24765 [Streptomyces violascens]|uniref:hypothetical protein n=1 Tax=Streptomyces violascens TaxID=67381 RepID=UPI0036472C74
MFHDCRAFWFETLRNLDLAAYGGSDVGEVIDATLRLPDITPVEIPYEDTVLHGHFHRDRPAFRPDWENVVGPVLDFLSQDPSVDPARIALLGVSLGGCLAPRSAAYEPRLAAVIALTVSSTPSAP